MTSNIDLLIFNYFTTILRSVRQTRKIVLIYKIALCKEKLYIMPVSQRELLLHFLFFLLQSNIRHENDKAQADGI